MKYLILGAGGTGGSIGAFLHHSGEDVTFIARGPHLHALQEKGLTFLSDLLGQLQLFPLKAYDTTSFSEKVDVIFVCVKSYSLDEIIPFLEKVSHEETLIIPILNGLGIGSQLAKKLPSLTILEGCIYIVSYMAQPGLIVQSGKIFKIVYGPIISHTPSSPQLDEVTATLIKSGIQAVYSPTIRKDTFEKFTFISPFATVGAYYSEPASAFQVAGTKRNDFIALNKELLQVGEAMGIHFENDLVAKNLSILDQLAPHTTASMQKDLLAGKKTEMDGLIFDVVRQSSDLGVSVPTYQKIALKLML